MAELKQIIQDGFQKKMTGRVMLVGVHEGATISGRLTLNAGQVTQVNVGHLVGLDAFKRLLSTVIRHVSVVESQAVEATIDPSLPKIEELLAHFEKSAIESTPTNPKVLTNSLADAVKQLAISAFEEVYGNKAEAKLSDVLNRFPPDENPREFIATCRAQIEMMLGTQRAEALVKPIFELLSNQKR